MNDKEEVKGMIDLHCHLLPAVDDGAQNLEESLAMAEKAVEQGITGIFPSFNSSKKRFFAYNGTLAYV